MTATQSPPQGQQAFQQGPGNRTGINGIQLVMLVVAMLVFGTLVGLWTIVKVFHWCFKKVPVVGGWIAHAFESVLEDAMRFVRADYDLLARPLAHVLESIIAASWDFVYQIVISVRDAKTWATQAFQAAISAGHAAMNYAANLVGGLRGEMQQGFTDIEQVTEHAIAGVEAEAKSLADSAAATGVAAAEFIGQLNANAVAQLAATVTTDVTDIEQMVEQAMAGVENQIRLLGDEVVVDTQRLVNQITDTATNTLNEAKTFTTVAVTALAPSVATQVLTQVEQDLGPIKTEVDQCLTPLCDAVKPNFNHLKDLLDLLKALADIFALGLLTALLVAAIENPKAAGDAVRTTMGWAITAGDDMAKLLFGLAGVKL